MEAGSVDYPWYVFIKEMNSKEEEKTYSKYSFRPGPGMNDPLWSKTGISSG